MVFNAVEFKPLTIAVLGQNMYWVDKRQKNDEVEYLKWRALGEGKTSKKEKIYKKDWVYESTRDLEAVQQNRMNGMHCFLLHTFITQYSTDSKQISK